VVTRGKPTRKGGSRHDLRKRERFIELRAKGWSYNRIAKEIRVSKPTLLKWNEEFKHRIADMRTIFLDELREKFHLLSCERVDHFGREIQKIYRELGHRDYSSVATERLPELLIKMHASLRRENVFAEEQTAAERPPETWVELVMRAARNHNLTEI
jgi:hypothetical protein